MDWISRWRHRIALEWGRGLDCVPLNSLRIDRVDGCFFVSKRRRWYAPYFVAVGNVYLRHLGVRTHVLMDRAWRLWECEVYRKAYGSVLLADRRDWVQIPLWPGRLLDDFLAAPMRTASEKLQAIRLATASLHRLHQLKVRWPDGQERSFSHGDATVRNVIVARRLDQAKWFDFDMAHDANSTETWRHADDLRTLIFSAAKWLPVEFYADLAREALTTYVTPSVIDALVVAVEQSDNRPNSFHLAQSGISYDQHLAIRTALLTATSAS